MHWHSNKALFFYQLTGKQAAFVILQVFSAVIPEAFVQDFMVSLFFTICQALGLMMALVVITRFKEQCWNLLINLMGLIREETSRFLWRQIGNYREFRRPRFWARRDNWKWTFWTLRLWFWKISWVMTLAKLASGTTLNGSQIFIDRPM